MILGESIEVELAQDIEAASLLVRPIHAERHLVEHAFREELVACILHDHEAFAPTSALSQTGFFQSHGSVASVEAAYGFGERRFACAA